MFAALPASVRAATLRLHLSADGSQTAKYYVAVVPAAQPLAKPLAEEITDQAQPAYTVPDGTYRVVVGAQGFATYISGTFEAAGTETDLPAVRLTPLATLAGRVLDADNNPVARARIGLPGMFRIDLPARLSQLAERHLARNDTTESDEAGLFLMPVHAQGTSYVFVEADGYAPTLLPRVNATDAGVGDIHLARGASLEVTFRDIDPRYARLHLIPRGVALPATLSASSATAIWTRPLSGNAQRWASLIAGSYDLCAAPLDELAETAPPRILAHITLKAGESQRIVVTLSPIAPPPAGDAAFSVPSGDDLTKLRVARYAASSVTEVPISVSEAGQASAFVIRSGCVPGAIYSVIGDGWIASVGPIVFPCEAPFALRPQQRGNVELRLRPPLGRTLPATGALESRACGAEPGSPSIVTPFEISPNGVAEVLTPIGCREATIRVGTLSRTRITHFDVAPESTTRLSPIGLQEGASLATRILDGGEKPVANALVRLYRTANFDKNHADVARLTPVAESVSDIDGAVLFAGIPDDDYILDVSRPGRLPVTTRSIRLRPQEHAYVDDIVLASHE